MSKPDYGLVARLLADEAETVLETLATNIKHEGGELHAQLANGDAIVLAVRGGKRGLWLDKSDMSGGDMLELVHRVLGKEDHRVAYDWGKRFLGLAEGDAARQALADRREAMRAREQDRIDEKVTLAERVNRAIARYLSGGSLPFTWSAAPALYLAGRGIRVDQLGGMPKTLRFSPTQHHVESARDWPAMLAPIVDPVVRKIIAVHCTYLAGDGAGHWRKAPIKPQKKVSARYRGAVIPLLRGASGKPLTLAPEGEAVMIAEGIENALAAVQLLGIDPAPRVFAGVAAANLVHITWPLNFAEVILVCDRDGEYQQAVAQAYDRAERKWLEAGLAVTRQMPPAGFKDFAAATEGLAGA